MDRTFYLGTTQLIFLGSATLATVNEWNHIAVCRVSGISSLYLNGTLTQSAPDNVNYDSSGMRLSIGYQVHGNARYPFTGIIGETRITKGVARYTESFELKVDRFDTVLNPIN